MIPTDGAVRLNVLGYSDINLRTTRPKDGNGRYPVSEWRSGLILLLPFSDKHGGGGNTPSRDHIS
jgi:hypothetical protein